jgi:F0F1-type ATP synthase epsilon subunit
MFKISILDIKTASSIFQGLVKYAVLPGEAGELSVLDFHQPIIVKLKKGMIKTDAEHISIKKGIAKMQDNELVVLTETAEDKSKRDM